MDEHKVKPNIFYRHFDLPPAFPVIGLLGPHWESTRVTGAPLRLHFHNCLEIGYFYKGSCTYYSSNGFFHIEAPCIFLTPANVPHMAVADEGVVCGWNWIYTDPMQLLTCLSPSMLHSLNKQLHALPVLDGVISADVFPDIYALIEMIVSELHQSKSHHDMITRELFSAFFLKLLRILPNSSPVCVASNSKVNILIPAISHIIENYMNDISIDMLAQLCHLSVSHFRRLFKSLLGLSPRDYLHMVRVERACTLLYGGKYTVMEIGMMVGYPTPSSFTRQFHRLHGISPRQWRQKTQSEDNPLVTAYLTSVPPNVQQFFPPKP